MTHVSKKCNDGRLWLGWKSWTLKNSIKVAIIFEFLAYNGYYCKTGAVVWGSWKYSIWSERQTQHEIVLWENTDQHLRPPIKGAGTVLKAFLSNLNLEENKKPIYNKRWRYFQCSVKCFVGTCVCLSVYIRIEIHRTGLAQIFSYFENTIPKNFFH